MKPRKIDLAFDWMQGQPRRAHHYRNEVWAALAELHPGAFGVSDKRKTPSDSLHRDMSQDPRFLRVDHGMFELANPDTPDVSTEPGEPKAAPRTNAILPVFNCPPATELKPVRPSSKVGQIVDMCAGDGARASDLMRLFVKPTGERWGRSSINGVFRWDLTHKGYGIRTIEDPAGVDHTYIVYAGTAARPKATGKDKKLSPLGRNRRLLAHLASFGELTREDLEDLGLDETHLGDWLDSLLVRRPEAYVVTPLFLHLIDGEVGPAAFTTRLAARFMGEYLRRHAPEPIAAIEEHVWSRFGGWHLTQPHGDDEKTRAYLSVPIHEPHAVAALERLDLFTHLPPLVIGDLIREPDFLAEQQSWSADAASKSREGPLSTQLHRGWKRPLILSAVDLRATDDGQVSIGEMKRAEVVKRSYVVSGLPLAGAGEWAPVTKLDRSAAAGLLLQHPVAAAILQFEVHRLFAELHGEPIAKLHAADTTVQIVFDAVGRGPLWRHVRTVLEQTGYRPVGASTQDSLWASAVHVTVKNLELLNVLERQGDFLCLTDEYESTIKAHPNHPLNRGEKPCRVLLSQFLAGLQRGQT